MRDIIKLIEEAEKNGQKIDRSAFLYLPPKPPAKDFAQCKTCIMFKPKSERCGIFGPKDKVTTDQSCGLYLHGKPNEDQECRSITTPKDAGLVDGPVRCENCSWADNGICGLYQLLNDKLPDVFDLDEKISPEACCNGWSVK